MTHPFSIAPALMAASLAVGLPIPRPVLAQADSDWVGRRIFPASTSATLRIDSKVIARAHQMDRLRVEKVSGPWLWATSIQATGWVLASDVIPLDRAVAHYTAKIRADPANALFYYNWRGHAWRESGDVDNALSDYTEVIRLDPRNSAVYVGRGVCWYEKKDYQNALADTTEAIRLDPTDATSYNNRGIYHAKLKHYDLALSDYSEAIRREPKDAEPYCNRGELKLNQLNDIAGALADLNEAIRLRPTLAGAFETRGQLHLRNQDVSDAIADFTKAIHFDPTNSDALAGRGKARHIRKDFDGAVADAGEAIRINPKSGRAYSVRALTRASKGDITSALADLGQAIKVDPDDPSGWEARARLYATSSDGNYRDGTRAIADATKACELTDWVRPDTIDTLAAALAEAGDFEAAIKREEEALRKLAKDAKNRPEFVAHLALFRSKSPLREPSTPPTASVKP